MPKKYKMTTHIPNSITTPAKIETRLGALEFSTDIPAMKRCNCAMTTCSLCVG